MPFLLLTGAAGGIATGILHHLAEDDWRIIATDHPARINTQDLRFDNDFIHWVPADLQALATDPNALREFEYNVRSCLKSSGLHAIIHNAAQQHLGPFENLTSEIWIATLAVNLLAPVAISKLFLRDLIATKGSIVHISSIHSRLTKPGFAAYATSKAALSGLTRAMAVELGDRVRVNAIEPAAIHTTMLEEGFANEPDKLVLLEHHHPSRAIGTPKDVAKAIAFLLDPANKFLNGCILELGGGIHSRLHDPM